MIVLAKMERVPYNGVFLTSEEYKHLKDTEMKHQQNSQVIYKLKEFMKEFEKQKQETLKTEKAEVTG